MEKTWVRISVGPQLVNMAVDHLASVTKCVKVAPTCKSALALASLYGSTNLELLRWINLLF